MPSRRIVLELFTAAAAGAAATVAPPQDCFEHPNVSYVLDAGMQGERFFDFWDFNTQDMNNGASEFVDSDTAVKDGLAQAFPTHTIVRTGLKDWFHKRKSVKLNTKGKWERFLMTMHFTHVPFGHGVWPSFWTDGDDWPNNGELDLLEWANIDANKVSFHTGGGPNRCKLDAATLNKPGCPQFPDVNGGGYDCHTDYWTKPKMLGCGPYSTQAPRFNGEQWSQNPGVVAAQFTDAFIKVFYIPEAEMPSDLSEGVPNPDAWDKWILSYYPFSASERAVPGSCPNRPFGPQKLVLSIELCGDWAGKTFDVPGQCVNREYPADDDCCTQYMWDGANDDYLHQRAFFNISWLKVYSEGGAPQPTPQPSPKPTPPTPQPTPQPTPGPTPPTPKPTPGPTPAPPSGPCKFKEDTDFDGGDIGVAATSTPEACCAACAAESACAVGVYYQSQCYLKDATSIEAPKGQGPGRVACSGGHNSAKCTCAEDTDYDGGDIGAFDAKDPGECCQGCAAVSNCSVGVQYSGRCYMKDSRAKAVPAQKGRAACRSSDALSGGDTFVI